MLNEIITGDARELAKDIPSESVDAVFCDPPYLRKNIEEGIYTWLAREAARILKPNGFCITYCGTYWLADAILQMCPYLRFYWEYRILFRDGYAAGIHYQRRTKPGSTPLLVFCKGQRLPYRTALDIYKGAGADKQFHKWGQDAYSVQYYLDCFSKLDDMVVDFFCGGGTVPAVCKQLGRNFIAFEIDPKAAEKARTRLHTVQPFLFEREAEQLTFQEGIA
jgi:DNA modification methylase